MRHVSAAIILVAITVGSWACSDSPSSPSSDSRLVVRLSDGQFQAKALLLTISGVRRSTPAT